MNNSSTDDIPKVLDREVPINPRARIRSFLQGAFERLDWRNSDSWPYVSDETFGRIQRKFRAKVEEFYERAEFMEGITPEQRAALRVVGESVLKLLWLDWTFEEDYHRASLEVFELLKERPYPRLSFDQLYCTPDSTERRIKRLLRDIEPSEARVLFLGDDDLGSLVLSSMFDGEIHLIELDERLISFIKEKAPNVKTHQNDLILGGVPFWLYEYFDAVVLDPPWDYRDAWHFINKAIFALKQDNRARIYLSFCPLHLEFLEQKRGLFETRLAKLGMTIESLSPAFHLYQLDKTEFIELLLSFIPAFEDPFLDYLSSVPYGFSHLFILRRLPFFKLNSLYKTFFKWWHSA